MVHAVMDPGLVNATDQCEWDAEIQVLITPEDAENEYRWRSWKRLHGTKMSSVIIWLYGGY
jgi:hypothetical protein